VSRRPIWGNTIVRNVQIGLKFAICWCLMKSEVQFVYVGTPGKQDAAHARFVARGARKMEFTSELGLGLSFPISHNFSRNGLNGLRFLRLRFLRVLNLILILI
jgi:hypothetical protein